MDEETTKHKRLESVPANACMLSGGSITLGDNGDTATSAPVRLLARSSQPIEHWYWGRVVHDMDGMKLHKDRLPIDYVHDSKEVIGYLNQFESTESGMVTSGALTPWKDTDRATEIISKMRMGVPYEASINFGGDGIKVEELADGQVTQVNGYQFEGPGMVIREWPLRGVAICPYGADANTESAELSARTFNVKRVCATMAQETGEETMETTEMAVDAVTEEAVEAVDPVEAEAVEEQTEDLAEVADDATEATDEPQDEATELTIAVDDLQRMVTEFGAAIALEVVANGGDYEAARELHYEQLKAENAALAAKLANPSPEQGEESPAEFADGDAEAPAKTPKFDEYELKGLTPAQAAFARDSKLKK